MTPRSTASEPTNCGIAFGDTNAPTSTVCSPAPTSASMKAMRAATPTGVFSFWRPSRGPTSTMRTWSLISILSTCRLDFGEFDTLADDITDLAFDHLKHAGERRAQGLFHLHHFKGEDRRALFQVGAHLGQQCHDRARQRCDDLVFAGLLLVVAAKRIDPMQVEAAGPCAQIYFVAFDDRHNMGFDAMEREIDTPGSIGCSGEGHFAFAYRKRRWPLAVVQAHLLYGALPVAECKHPLSPANRHPASHAPGRIHLNARRFRFFIEDRSDGCAQFKIVRHWRGRREVL